MTESESERRRAQLFKLLGAIGTAAILVVAVLIVVSQSGDEERGVETAELFEGIPRDGSVLGEPTANVRLVEYGDMQCPHCRNFANDVMPDIIEGPVRSGALQVQFKNWAILGPGSGLAAKAAMAAGEQGLYWEYLDTFYADESPDTSIDGLTRVAEEAGVPDIAAWEESVDNPAWDEVLLEIDEEARALGFNGTPSFALVRGDDEPVPIAPPESLQDLESHLGGI